MKGVDSGPLGGSASAGAAPCARFARSQAGFFVAHTNEEADDEGRRRRAGEAARCGLIIIAPSVVVTVVVVVVPSAAVVVVVVVLVDMVGVVVWGAFGFDAEQAAERIVVRRQT